MVDVLLLVAVLALAGYARVFYIMEFAGGGEAVAIWHVQDLPPASAGDAAPQPAAAAQPPPGEEAKPKPDPGPPGPPSPPSPPSSELDQLVEKLKQKELGDILDGFKARAPLGKNEEATAHVAPLYPIFRALVERFMPENLATPVAGLRWVQLGLGTLACGCYFALALRAFGHRLVALLAGAFCALNPFWIVNTAELNDGVLTSFLLAASLALGCRVGQQGGALAGLLYGFMLAFLSLARAALLPFALAALFWFMIRSRSVRQGWLCAFLAFLGFWIVISPWSLHLYKQFDRPVPVVDTAWWHLWVGNNPAATGGPSTPRMEELLKPDLRDKLAQQKQAERYEALAQEVANHAREYPGDTLRNRLRAGLGFFAGGWVLNGEHDIVYGPKVGDAEPKDNPWLVGSLYGALVVMLLLGLWGWRWSYGFRHDSMPLQLALFWAPLPYLLCHVEWLHGPRLPLDGALMTLAALGLVCLIPGIGTPLLRGESASE